MDAKWRGGDYYDAPEGEGPQGVCNEVFAGGALVGDGGANPQHRHGLQRRVEPMSWVVVDKARSTSALKALHPPQQARIDNADGDSEPEGFQERSVHCGRKLL